MNLVQLRQHSAMPNTAHNNTIILIYDSAVLVPGFPSDGEGSSPFRRDLSCVPRTICHALKFGIVDRGPVKIIMSRMNGHDAAQSY